MDKVIVYDTTLRDGSQGEGISFTVSDKLEVVRLLDDFGIDYIEGGWPGSNEKDLAFFDRVKDLPLKHSRVVAFTSTRRKGQRIENDVHTQMVLQTGLKHCAVVGKTWDFHVEAALRTDLDENLAMIFDTIEFLKQNGIEAIFDAEHFFDGYKRNPEYALRCLDAAKQAGADWFVLCDTNGGSLPDEVAKIVEEVAAKGFGPLGIHAHNDSGVALANSLAAVRAGAVQVQGTINGFGERTGNTDLCGLLPNLVLKMKVPCHVQEHQLQGLHEVSQRLYEIARKTPVGNQPFVGHSSFAHKAGIHVSAILRNPELYEHIPPQSVGNERRVLVSELSGESNVLYQLQSFGLTAPPAAVAKILARIKRAELDGFSFEQAGTSLELLIREELGLAQRYSEARATATSVADGVAVSMQWQDGQSQNHSAKGHGTTAAAAMCQALGLFPKLSLLKEDAVSLTAVDGTVRYRAILAAKWQGMELNTLGVAQSQNDAMAEAVLQMVYYLAATADRVMTQQA
ncbi:citramalate synthase [Alicyclobacillus tolerans]|uniref:citramalate synthase n=1 Tax=Alicyclobacillus tolerans TaxID=90970 RepID=UPI001F019C89|nr:citramalate synthase [Alicyclobacillus tolerans]MCF8565327.1 citramalate synthase [Alicyclobacillus tolerans]